MIRKAYNLTKNLHDEIPYRLMNGKAMRPLKVIWELTYRCNLRCQFCYLVHEGRDKKMDELTTDEIKSVIDQFGRVFPIITYTGGEPFVRSDIMEILRYTKRKNMCGVLTNGVMLTDDICKQLVEMGLDSVTISVDGPEEIHDKVRNMKGCFQKAMNAFSMLQYWKSRLGKKKPYLHINAVIVPQNVKHLHKIVEITAELDLDSCSFQTIDPSLDRSGLNISGNDFTKYKKPTIFGVDKIDPDVLRKEIRRIRKAASDKDVNVKFVPVTFSEDDLVDYYSQKIDYSRCGCRVPWYMMTISPEGEVFPCYNYRIGNIRKDRVKKLWNNHHYKKFRREIKKRILPGCIGCCNIIYGRKK